MTSYIDDPRIIKTRFPATCKTCNCNIPKGINCYYWPRGKHIYCLSCGEAAYRVFLSNSADEEVYHGRGNPYSG